MKWIQAELQPAYNIMICLASGVAATVGMVAGVSVSIREGPSYIGWTVSRVTHATSTSATAKVSVDAKYVRTNNTVCG
jgi:hypothetical protein